MNILFLKMFSHVPKLFTNLISIQKLILDSNYSVNFSFNIYKIQGKELRRMIGLAWENAGLYYLDGPNGQETKEEVHPMSCLVESNKD